jgi:hypothetical protein
MSRPSSRQSALSAHSAASLRSSGSFSPLRASAGWGAPICGRPGASIAQYEPWLKHEWRSPLNSFKYGSAEPVRVSERLLAVGDEASKPVGAKELWNRVDTDELAEAEHRVQMLSGSLRGQQDGTFGGQGTDPSTVSHLAPDLSASWRFGQEPVVGLYDKQAAVSRSRSMPAVRTGAFKPSRSLPSTFAATAGRKTDASEAAAPAATAFSGGGGGDYGDPSAEEAEMQLRAAAAGGAAGGEGRTYAAGGWLTTEQRAWLRETSSSPRSPARVLLASVPGAAIHVPSVSRPGTASRPTTAGSAASRRGSQRKAKQQQQQQQRHGRGGGGMERQQSWGFEAEAEAEVRNRIDQQQRRRARQAEREREVSRIEQWREDSAAAEREAMAMNITGVSDRTGAAAAAARSGAQRPASSSSMIGPPGAAPEGWAVGVTGGSRGHTPHGYLSI